jgi:hypothetical protein
MVPRLLTKVEAAAYCGLTVRQFSRHVSKHVTARRFGQAKLWDIKALDAWLDKLYGAEGDDGIDFLKTLDDLPGSSLRHSPSKQKRH